MPFSTDHSSAEAIVSFVIRRLLVAYLFIFSLANATENTESLRASVKSQPTSEGKLTRALAILPSLMSSGDPENKALASELWPQSIDWCLSGNQTLKCVETLDRIIAQKSLISNPNEYLDSTRSMVFRGYGKPMIPNLEELLQALDDSEVVAQIRAAASLSNIYVGLLQFKRASLKLAEADKLLKGSTKIPPSLRNWLKIEKIKQANEVGDLVIAEELIKSEINDLKDECKIGIDPVKTFFYFEYATTLVQKAKWGQAEKIVKSCGAQLKQSLGRGDDMARWIDFASGYIIGANGDIPEGEKLLKSFVTESSAPLDLVLAELGRFCIYKKNNKTSEAEKALNNADAIAKKHQNDFLNYEYRALISVLKNFTKEKSESIVNSLGHRPKWVSCFY